MKFRSLLFTPAHTPQRFEKALGSQADIVIFDLEDAVAPARKAEARDNLCRLRDRAAGRRVAVRVNAADTDWHCLDLAAAVEANVEFIMLPKCAGSHDILRLDTRLDGLESGHNARHVQTGIIALAGEDASSLASLDYKGMTPRLKAIALGAEDLTANIGIEGRDAEGKLSPIVRHARLLIVLAACRAGVAAIDTPYTDIANLEANAREACDAAALGFSGKLCIHPSQIDDLNAAFEPQNSAVVRAKRIIAAFTEAPNAGVLELDGKMVDKAHLHGALNILSRSSHDSASKQFQVIS